MSARQISPIGRFWAEFRESKVALVALIVVMSISVGTSAR